MPLLTQSRACWGPHKLQQGLSHYRSHQQNHQYHLINHVLYSWKPGIHTYFVEIGFDIQHGYISWHNFLHDWNWVITFWHMLYFNKFNSFSRFACIRKNCLLKWLIYEKCKSTEAGTIHNNANSSLFQIYSNYSIYVMNVCNSIAEHNEEYCTNWCQICKYLIHEYSGRRKKYHHLVIDLL